MRVCVRMCLGACVWVRASVCAFMQTPTHAHTHTRKHPHELTHAHPHSHTHTHNELRNLKGVGDSQQRWEALPSTFVFFYYHTHRHTHARRVCYLLFHQRNRGPNKTTPEYYCPTITIYCVIPLHRPYCI